MTITNEGNQIVVTDGTYNTATYKSAVIKVESYLSRYIRIFVTEGYKPKQWAKLPFASITEPATSDLDSLVSIVKGYLNESVKFTASSAQTQFDCTGYFILNDSFYVVLNGQRQSWSVSRSGNVAIVANASEFDEVIVVQPRVL